MIHDASIATFTIAHPQPPAGPTVDFFVSQGAKSSTKSAGSSRWYPKPVTDVGDHWVIDSEQIHWIGLRENLQETHGFYHQIGWVFRLKCSHHPILW